MALIPQIDKKQSQSNFNVHDLSIDIESVKSRIEQARSKYKPAKVRCILIAEAPPDNVERFFYYESVQKADYLFLGVMKVLYPALANEFMNGEPRRDPKRKEEMLRKFQADGFYLFDLSGVPIGYSKGSLLHELPGLVKRVRKVADHRIHIVLIKVNVYDVAYEPLVQSGFANVVDARIPFPSTSWQQLFHEAFKNAIEF